jgi:hypothetical protein
MEQAATALKQALVHYSAQDISDEQKGILSQVLEQLSAQLAKQATDCKSRQNVMLGQWIVARGAADEAPTDLPTRRVGWAVRLWRATAARAWDWAFAM